MSGDSPLRALAKHRLGPLLLLGGVALTLGGGLWLGLPGGLLIAAAAVLSLVIGLIWQSLQHLSGETELTFEEALSLAAPTTEEEQKRAVLRALKDLEYERSVGKISEEDFRELSERYRAEAKRLILVVDDTLEERRQRAQRLFEEHLKAAKQQPQSRKKNRKKSANPADENDGSDENDSATQAAKESSPRESQAPANGDEEQETNTASGTGTGATDIGAEGKAT